MHHRHFNSLIVENGLIKKTSIRTEQFNSEINWYINFPKRLNKYLPEIKEYSIGNNPYIMMKYYESKTLSDIFVSDEASIEFWEQTFDAIHKMLEEFYAYKLSVRSTLLKEDLRKMYYDKTLNRLYELKKDGRWAALLKEELVIKKRKISFETFLVDFEKTIPKLIEDTSINFFNLIHGDLCLGNIIYNSDNQIILIDPRGNFGSQTIYGDRDYDLAKLSHSLVGGYDLIINDKYRIFVDKNTITLDLYFSEKQRQITEIFKNKILSKNNANRINLIESLLFLSMLPLHSEDFNRQLAFFSQGILSFYNIIEGDTKFV